MKFKEDLSKGSGDMEQTRKCYRLTDCQTKGIPLTLGRDQKVTSWIYVVIRIKISRHKHVDFRPFS